MSDEKAWAIGVTVMVVAVALVLAFICYRVGQESTQREVQCVKYGGSYVQVANGSKMECRK